MIHLVTAADGAVKFYMNENNEARYESVEEACALDKKLINAWIGHPHFSIIENKNYNFSQKVEKCVETVCKYIGLPNPTSFYKKYLLANRETLDVITPKDIKMEYF